MLSTQQLKDIQANIFKGHGRGNAWCLFLKFNTVASFADKRRWLAIFSEKITSAQAQFEMAREYKAQLGLKEADRKTGFNKQTLTSFLLSAKGYRSLGCNDSEMPSDPSFRLGMKHGLVNGSLGDAPVIEWESYFQQDIDAMILVANEDENVLAKLHIDIANDLMKSGVGTIVFVEKGNTLPFDPMQPKDSGYVEHFGFRDGIINPRVALDGQGNLESSHEQLLLTSDPTSGLGSYFVFRKLEQNVSEFNRQVERIAGELGLEKEHVEAQIIGRFKDGTPLELSPNCGGDAMADFDFNADPDGKRCPFHAHIRKVNPRIEGFAVENENGTVSFDPREKQIVRRGITYGRRSPGMTDEPAEGVGLLFMSYQCSIRHQFEHVQKEWCNRTDFISPSLDGEKVTGIDPIIGSKIVGNQTQLWNTTWASHDGSTVVDLKKKGVYTESNSNRRSFKDVVKLKGGEYFYAPPISFFKILAAKQPSVIMPNPVVYKNRASIFKPMFGSKY